MTGSDEHVTLSHVEGPLSQHVCRAIAAAAKVKKTAGAGRETKKKKR